MQSTVEILLAKLVDGDFAANQHIFDVTFKRFLNNCAVESVAKHNVKQDGLQVKPRREVNVIRYRYLEHRAQEHFEQRSLGLLQC